MMRRGAAVAAVLAAGMFSGVPAAAQPAAPTECAYTLSAPYVVDVAGTPMVTATMQPAACLAAVTTVLQACLSTPGKVGRCNNSNGNVTAQVYLSPYVPGLTYTVSGRGCAATTTPPTSFCSSLGPKSAVL